MTASCLSEEDLPAQIKEAVPIPALLEREGLRPNRQGFLRCPFHDGDQTPSLKIYPGGRGWYCFGCHQGGDVISLAMALYGTGYRGAVNRLNRDFGLGLGRRQREYQRTQANMAAYERRRRTEAAEKQYEQDWKEWAQCNTFIQAGPDGKNPWPWCRAVIRRDLLQYRMEEYEGGGNCR